MSAFVCSPEHFKALAIFATTRRNGSLRVDPRYIKSLPQDAQRGTQNYTQPELATLYADVLYQENIRSVGERYPSDTLQTMPGLCEKPSHIKVTGKDCITAKLLLTPIALLKMCDCLEYQSCETDDYRQTTAFDLLDAIRGAAIHALPGYDSADWDFNV